MSQEDLEKDLEDEVEEEEEDVDAVDKDKLVLLKDCGQKSSLALVKIRQMRHDANNKLMSYLLMNRLILDMFAGSDNLEFKVKLVNQLRELKFNEFLINCLFRLMPSFKDASVKLFNDMGDETEELVFDYLTRYSFELLAGDDNDNFEAGNTVFISKKMFYWVLSY